MNGLHDMNAPDGKKLTWGLVLSTTYSFYRAHLWAFWRMGLPVAILAYLFPPFKRLMVTALYKLLSAGPAGPGWVLKPHIAFPVAWSIDFITGAVYWILSTILFAAVVRKVLQADDDNTPLSDAYSCVRQRLKVLLVFGILTWMPFWLARELASFAGSKLCYILAIKASSILGTMAFSLPLLIVAGLFSRLGLAVPALMDNNEISVREALRFSIRKTEDWEPFFMFFLTKSFIVGYGTYWIADLGFHWLWSHTSITASAYYWVTWGVYVCLFAILASPLFIAFCVLYLYRESETNPEAALTAPAIG